MQIRYPSALKKGGKIGITAPSSGVTPEHYARLDLVLNYLRTQGYEVEEGQCLRNRIKHVSGPKEQRASELLRFWRDPGVNAIMPPWGGEILVEILPLIDFEELQTLPPKWISGYSDTSTLLFAITIMTGIATVHGSTLMELVPSQKDPLTSSLMNTLQLKEDDEFVQYSSSLYQKQWLDFRTHPHAPLNLTEVTQWKALKPEHEQNGLQFSGRIIGGCLDTIARLVGTPYGDLPRFVKSAGPDGAIFYFENCEMPPCELIRTLWNIRLAGWFKGLSGILIGRSSGPDAKSENDLSYVEALQSVLADTGVPILYDVDIGHRPPQLSIINGSLANIEFKNSKAKVTQKLS